MLVQVPSMQGNNLLVPALFAIIAWVLLIYVVFTRPGKRPAAPRPLPLYRTPFRFEKKWTRDLSDANQQLYIVKTASFEKNDC
jgi:hypothetical protein